MKQPLSDILAESLSVYARTIKKTWPALAAVLIPANAFIVWIQSQIAVRFGTEGGIPIRAIKIEQTIERENIRNSIIFAPTLYGSVFLNLMKKPPYDDRGNLILLDIGEENFYAAAYFMDKEPFEGAYLIDYYPKLAEKTSVTPLFEATRGKMIFEFENKLMLFFIYS